MNAKNPQQRYARTVRLLQVVLLLLIFAVLGTAGMALMNGPRLFFPPTPTLTPTAGPQLTATPDFRTTLIAEDVATQDAYATLVVASGGRLSPLGLPATATLAVVAPALTPTATLLVDTVATSNPVDQPPIDPNSGGVVISLPLVNGGQPFPTVPPTATIFPGVVPTDTLATPLPPELLPTETPSPTFTPPLPTDTPTPTPTLFFVPTLRAVVTSSPGATAYAGPSSLYNVIGSVNFNESLTLLNRDETGEWVYSCCVASQSYWIRQAHAPPRDNQLPNGAPPNATPNDVRWLQVLQAPAAAQPILTPTPVIQDSYPFSRYVRGNNSRVPNLPQPPFQIDWPSPFVSRTAMNSAVIVAGGYVIVGNQDNDLYGLDRTFGNQQWAHNLGSPMINAPVAQDSVIYLVNNSGVVALNIVGNQVQQLWTTGVGTSLSNLYLAGNRLFIVTQEGDSSRRVLTLDRTNGQLLAERYTGTAQLSANLAIGNQLIYIGDPALRAIDINKFDVVWQQPVVVSVNAPPLYVTNGPVALAELYVADSTNMVYLLNANTGQIIWNINYAVQVTGMAVNDDNLFIVGNSTVQAVARRTGASLWRIDVPGNIVGGPIVDGDQVIVVTNSGNIRMFNNSGGQIDALSLPNGALATGAPAVSGLYLYIPGNNGTVHALRGQP